MFGAILMTLLSVFMVMVTIWAIIGLIAGATWLGSLTNSLYGLIIGLVVGIIAAGGWVWLLAKVITSAVLRWKGL